MNAAVCCPRCGDPMAHGLLLCPPCAGESCPECGTGDAFLPNKDGCGHCQATLGLAVAEFAAWGFDPATIDFCVACEEPLPLPRTKACKDCLPN